MNVTITSATALSSVQVKKITEAVEKKHKNASVETVVDPSVIGGLKLRIGSKTLDGTVSQKLAMIKNQLAKELN